MAIRNIDILTSQNVVISYELATLGNRLSSNFIDLLVVYGINFIRTELADGGLNPSFMFLSILFIWAYHLVFAIFFRGNTLGMRAVGIKVMRPGGGNVEFSDLFLRWITRPLDITLSSGALAIFLILGSEKRQRLGDMLAGTVVVHKKHSMHFSLKDILMFHEKTNTEGVQYPGVRHIRESDMLVIKNLLNNQNDYSFAVHKKAMEACSDRMAELLGLDTKPQNTQVFLQTLVNDYIILTR